VTDVSGFLSVVPQWCTRGHDDIYSVTIAIDALRAAVADKPWWHEWPTFLGIFFAALLGFSSSLIIEKRKEKRESLAKADETRKKQAREINATIMAFANDISKLLTFKAECVLPYKEDVRKIVDAGNLGLEKFQETRLTLTHLFRFTPRLIFNDTSYVERLVFITSYRPIYLITFHQIHENLLSINYDAEERNIFIRQHMEKSVYGGGINIGQMKVAIEMLASYSKALEVHVDAALWFMQLGTEHLIEYGQKWLAGETIKKSEVIEKFKHLLPAEDDFVGYRKMIEESIVAEKKKV
jgi:hypothetical protein